jgi:hypothetical protein
MPDIEIMDDTSEIDSDPTDDVTDTPGLETSPPSEAGNTSTFLFTLDELGEGLGLSGEVLSISQNAATGVVSVLVNAT